MTTRRQRLIDRSTNINSGACDVVEPQLQMMMIPEF